MKTVTLEAGNGGKLDSLISEAIARHLAFDKKLPKIQFAVSKCSLFAMLIWE